MGEAGEDTSKEPTAEAKNDSRNTGTLELNPAVRGVHLKNRMH